MNLYNIIRPKPDLDYFEDFVNEEFYRIDENQRFEDIINNKLNLEYEVELDDDIDISIKEAFEIYFDDNIGSCFRNIDTLQELESNILDIYSEFVKEYLINPFLDELQKKDLTELNNLSIFSTDTIKYEIEFDCPFEGFYDYNMNVRVHLSIHIREEDQIDLAYDTISNFIYEKSYNPHNKFGRHMISWRAEQEGIIGKD